MQADEAIKDSRQEHRNLLHSNGLLSVIVGIAACAPFVAALDGELLWDDPIIIGRLAQLSSWWKVFSSDLFGVAAGDPTVSGAIYWRPLVSLAYYAELRLFPAAPEFVMHAVNIGWHVAAAILLFRALRRWTHCCDGVPLWGCAAAAAIWAVFPLKAENVAWISGRADPMGTALLLAALELLARGRTPTSRVLIACLGTAVALLSKEAMIIATLFFVLEIRTSGRSWRDAMIGPEAIGSGSVALSYLFLRAATLRIEGANAAAFAGISVVDRGILVLETIGHASAALVQPWQAYVLKGPYAFRDGRLVHEPLMASIGLVALASATLAAWRIPWLRLPVATIFVGLLPSSNLVPNALESRMSDRFLYVPSIGVALAIAVGLGRIRSKQGRALAGLAAGFVALAFGLVTFGRSSLFVRARDLWAWERSHGSGAAAIPINAAWAAERAGDIEQARTLCLEAANRQQQLGHGSGVGMILQAARLHARWVGESDRTFVDGYIRVLEALLSRREESIEISFPGDSPRVIFTGSEEALDIGARQRATIGRELLLRRARLESSEAIIELDRLADACSDCLAPVVDAALGHLASADPDGAQTLIMRLPDGLPQKAELSSTAGLQKRVFGPGGCAGVAGRATALYLGEAYAAACRAAAGHDLAPGGCGDAIRIACALAGTPLPGPIPHLEGQPLQRWNVDRLAREAVVATGP